MSKVHISITAEELFSFDSFFAVTNSILTTWLVMLVLILFSIYTTRKLKLVPGSLQSIVEIIIGGLYNLFYAVTLEKTRVFFPLLATLFLFIIGLNWIGLLPGVGTIGKIEHAYGHEKFVPIFRAGTADLNTTLAFAIVTMVAVQYAGLKNLGTRYLKKFFDFTNPIYFFVGLLEIVSEISKIISFSFRLFGNIFAGEVLLTVIAFLIPLFAPLPFIGLELFVGFIQALVFSMLASVFLKSAISAH